MIIRKDLADVGDENYQARQEEYLHCQNCGYDFGGTRGDYFLMGLDTPFYCMHCGSQNIALVKDVTKTVVIKQ